MGLGKILFCGNDERYLDKKYIAFSDSANGGSAFRLTSMVNADGTLVAVVCKQTVGEGFGYIELAVRRSDDGGESWSEVESIATPPARMTGEGLNSYCSAYFVNPCMAVAPNGDIVMLVDFYPESKDLKGNKLFDKKKIPYASYKRRMRPVLYDRDGKFYIIREDGVVLNNKQHETIYKVTDWKGSLYKGEEYVGNIFLNGKTGEVTEHTTFGAPLKAPKRNYIYMLRSSDKGKTWSDPVDVTSDFLIKEDGTFIAVSPGSSITTPDGRIVMPLYAENKQSVSVYSIDDGESWHRMTQQPYNSNTEEWQAVLAPDGAILALGTAQGFDKTPLSISYDNAKHWEKCRPTGVLAPKCQKSVMNIANYVFCSHPSERTRENGVISIGRFKRSGGKTVGIDWYADSEINTGYFGYSCMAQIDEDHIGVLYEAQPSSLICFKKFRIEDLIKF